MLQARKFGDIEVASFDLSVNGELKMFTVLGGWGFGSMYTTRDINAVALTMRLGVVTDPSVVTRALRDSLRREDVLVMSLSRIIVSSDKDPMGVEYHPLGPSTVVYDGAEEPRWTWGGGSGHLYEGVPLISQ